MLKGEMKLIEINGIEGKPKRSFKREFKSNN